MSRAEHHADSPDLTVRQAKAQLAYILQHRTSRSEAISSRGLADAVGLKATTVRDCVKEIRTEYSLPVVSCSMGYYVIQDTDALERELGRIQDEIGTRRETMRELTSAFNHRKHE